MRAFPQLFNEEYNTLQEQWENTLKQELKLEDVSAKTSKKHMDLGSWPTLSLASSQAQHLGNSSAWKKASQTYISYHPDHLAAELADDLHSGVRTFFFHKESLSQELLKIIFKQLESFPKAQELDVFFLGSKPLTFESSLHVIDEADLLMARDIHQAGGHNVHELAGLTLMLIESLEQPRPYIGLFFDSHFFKNIAKLRALKLLAKKVYAEAGLEHDLKYVTLNSYREWTLFERYSNMLRNNVQVASGLIGGADSIQSSGYQSIFELEAEQKDLEHEERSHRMARNTAHILSLESMLGIVEDAAFGSFHLENLTQEYAKAAWQMMQDLLKRGQDERKLYWETEVQKIQEQRKERVRHRKDVMAGMNDFPDSREHLNISLKKTTSFRVAREFEELRLRVEGLSNKPKVKIILQGEYSVLNNRVNFIKNYFELLGLEVIDPIHSQEDPAYKIIVLCANDEDYSQLATKVGDQNSAMKFVAGKIHLEGFEPLHAGQNVYQVLKNLVDKLVGGAL